MKVFVVKMNNNELVNEKVDHDLGIRIKHLGDEYSLSEDNHGRLVLRSINGVQLVLKPQAANAVSIESIG